MAQTEINNPPQRDVLAELKSVIPGIVQLNLHPNEIPDNANLYDDCGLDSISVVDFLVATEKLFGISLDERNLDQALFNNLSVFAEYVRSTMAATESREHGALSA